MLDDRQRIGRYLAQSGRTELTPRQRRRIRHKEGHQSLSATLRRNTVMREKQERFRASVMAAAS